MEYPQILTQLVEILTPLAGGRVTVNEATELVGDLALDSLKVMNLVLAVEDQFDVSLPVNALADVKTVRDLAAQVQSRMGPHR